MHNWEQLNQLIGEAEIVDLSPTIEHNMPKWPTHPQIIVDPTITQLMMDTTAKPLSWESTPEPMWIARHIFYRKCRIRR